MAIQTVKIFVKNGSADPVENALVTLHEVATGNSTHQYTDVDGLSLFAQIGLIVLMGLVMKNGILLVEYANQFREEGMTAHEAIMKAAPLRLRPILFVDFCALARHRHLYLAQPGDN